MPENDPKPTTALPQPRSATAAGARRQLLRRTNLLGPDSEAGAAFENGADRPEPFTQGQSNVDPFKVRGA